MGVISNLTGFNVGYNFTPTLSDTTNVENDPANTKAFKYVWVIPQIAATISGLDLEGNALSITFVAKDLNLIFPIPFTRLKTTGAVGPITTLNLTNPGTLYNTATGRSVTGGTGTGGKVNILTLTGPATAPIATISLNTAGTGYTVGDVLTISGDSADATVTVTNVSASGRIIAVFPQ